MNSDDEAVATHGRECFFCVPHTTNMANLDPALVNRLPPDLARTIARAAISLGMSDAWRRPAASLEASMPLMIYRWTSQPPVKPDEYVIIGWPASKWPKHRGLLAAAVARHPDTLRPGQGPAPQVFQTFAASSTWKWTRAPGAAKRAASMGIKQAVTGLLPRGTRRRTVSIIHARRQGAGGYTYRFTERTNTPDGLAADALAFAGW